MSLKVAIMGKVVMAYRRMDVAESTYDTPKCTMKPMPEFPTQTQILRHLKTGLIIGLLLNEVCPKSEVGHCG